MSRRSGPSLPRPRLASSARQRGFVVFELRGALLALFPAEKLAADAHAEPEIGQGGIRFNIIITVDAPDEVDALAETVRRAGGRFTKPTDAEFFVGRTG